MRRYETGIRLRSGNAFRKRGKKRRVVTGHDVGDYTRYLLSTIARSLIFAGIVAGFSFEAANGSTAAELERATQIALSVSGFLRRSTLPARKN
jgi:hypothetical protein